MRLRFSPAKRGGSLKIRSGRGNHCSPLLSTIPTVGNGLQKEAEAKGILMRLCCPPEGGLCVRDSCGSFFAKEIPMFQEQLRKLAAALALVAALGLLGLGQASAKGPAMWGGIELILKKIPAPRPADHPTDISQAPGWKRVRAIWVKPMPGQESRRSANYPVDFGGGSTIRWEIALPEGDRKLITFNITKDVPYSFPFDGDDERMISSLSHGSESSGDYGKHGRRLYVSGLRYNSPGGQDSLWKKYPGGFMIYVHKKVN